MKKIFLSISLLLFTVAGFSQVFKPIKIDSLVTVTLPSDVQKKDTLGQQVFTGKGSYGYMIVIRAANAKNNKPLKKETDLNKVLKNYIKGIKGQSKDGAVYNTRDTIIGGRLEAKVFTLSQDSPEGLMLRSFILLYTQDATYTFEYLYPEERKEVVKAELKAYTSSIKLSAELQRNDQYISNAKGMSTIMKVAIFGGGALLIIIIIVIIRRKKKKE